MSDIEREPAAPTSALDLQLLEQAGAFKEQLLRSPEQLDPWMWGMNSRDWGMMDHDAQAEWVATRMATDVAVMGITGMKPPEWVHLPLSERNDLKLFHLDRL